VGKTIEQQTAKGKKKITKGSKDQIIASG